MLDISRKSLSLWCIPDWAPSDECWNCPT